MKTKNKVTFKGILFVGLLTLLEDALLAPVRATDDFIEKEITGPPLDPNQGSFEKFKKRSLSTWDY